MGRPAPFQILLLARFFAPSQGFFFILVYSRPHVRSLRIKNPELSWFQAFMIAFKAGGDNDSGGRSSIANNGLTVIDAEGIDAPRLPEAERQRRQEKVRREYQRLRNSSCLTHSSKDRISPRVSFSDNVLKNFYRDDDPNEVKIADDLEVAKR